MFLRFLPSPSKLEWNFIKQKHAFYLDFNQNGIHFQNILSRYKIGQQAKNSLETLTNSLEIFIFFFMILNHIKLAKNGCLILISTRNLVDL